MLNEVNLGIFNAINIYARKNGTVDQLVIIIAEYLPIIFVLFLLYLWFNKKGRKNYTLYCGYSAIIGILLNFTITLFYFHPRPFMNNIGTLLIKHTSETSFPSDHTTFMLSIAFTLFYFKQTRKAGRILLPLAIAGGIARIYCGIHYPFDIFGSILIAMVSSSVVFIYKKKLQKFNNRIIDLCYNVLKLKHKN